MTALDRKLVRDLWQMKGQALAICLVIACGIATFVMSLCTLSSLRRTQEGYYDRYHFAQVFAHLKRAPDSLVYRIAELPGVARLQTRIVEKVTLEVPGLTEPATGRLISVPAHAGHTELNARHLRRGRGLEPGRSGEVLVSEGFAQANGFAPGDSVRAILNGRRQDLRIVGIALSPEYIYQIREGDILPDDRRFGVFWMAEQDLASAFDMQGAFNDVCLTLAPGASEPEVLRRLDQLLEPHGGLGAFGREDQPSHKFVSNELKELRGMALVVPTIFLLVAAFLLHVVISRLIQTQREQIAALQALGYTRLELARHYLGLVFLIVLVGVVLGIVVGARLGMAVTAMYTRFFRFPVFAFYLDPAVVALSILISCAAAAGGTLGAVALAVRLPPAEAMRPEPPARFGPTLLERLGLGRFLSPVARMVLRQLERRPIRTALSVVGIALAVAMLILGNFMVDALDYVMEAQFEVAQRQDVTLTFGEPASIRALWESEKLPGVRDSEPFRAVAARVRSGHRSRRVSVLGVRTTAHLNRIMDIDRREIALPPAGVVISGKLAEVLGVGLGDLVTVEVLEGRRPVRQLPITGLINDFAGISAYMDLRAVNRLMEEGEMISGVYLAADLSKTAELFARIRETPRVVGVNLGDATLTSFRRTVAENLLRMRLFNVAFAAIIAFGVVYNSARVALAERTRELATLRVMGFYRSEIALALLGELAAITLAAIPLGLVMGRVLGAAVIRLAYDTELFRIPLVIHRSTYTFAATVVLVAAVLSAWMVRGLLDRIDLVAVLKCKE